MQYMQKINLKVRIMNKWLELILGLVLIIAPIYLVLLPIGAAWAQAAISFIQGFIVVALVLIGLTLLFAGISDLKA